MDPGEKWRTYGSGKFLFTEDDMYTERKGLGPVGSVSSCFVLLGIPKDPQSSNTSLSTCGPQAACGTGWL